MILRFSSLFTLCYNAKVIRKTRKEVFFVPRCEVCGKAASVGNRVSHSQIKTKRTWSPNIQRVHAIVNGHSRRIYACTSCLRSGKVKRAVVARAVSQE